MTHLETANRDHPRAPHTRIATTTTVAEAAFELLAERTSAAVVYRDGQPVGIVTVEDLAGRDGRAPLPDALVADVMTHECVRIAPGAGVDETLRAYREAAWLSLRRRRPFEVENVRRRERSFLVFEPNRADRRPS